MTYEEKAYCIIKESIKSAIFIDEKAQTFFQKEALQGHREEDLSVELFENFRSNGISLAIHKYKIGDEKVSQLKDYLFEKRDLVLLDWNLQEKTGEEFSLNFLSDIVKRPHIHFCAIYTSEKGVDLDKIFYNILSYFSNSDKQYYSSVKELLELIDGFDQTIKDTLNYININRDSKIESGRRIGEFRAKNSQIANEIIEITKEKDLKCALIKASIATMDTLKSDMPNPCPDITSFESKTIVINNTIITMLNKDENNAIELLKKLSLQIASQTTSFTQLLGLEMQCIFSKNSSFIDANLLHVPKEALIYHREWYKKEQLEQFFPEFLKEIMLEKASLNLRSYPFSLLEESFLNDLKAVTPQDSDLAAMNVFYNSTKLKNGKKVNFGDVFFAEYEKRREYYICITALCDCLRSHEKIESNFFFAKGAIIKRDKALRLGDSAFISYLSKEEIVVWTDVSSLDDSDNYKPKYIRPLSFNIAITNFDENNNVVVKRLDSKGNVTNFNLTYITTIKQNYTQRIANHAFSHPLRVGVDFVKK